MKFLLYLLLCLACAFGVYSGGSIGDYTQETIIGIIILFVLGGIFILCFFLLDRTSLSYKKALLYALLILVSVIIIFCGLCILVEFLVNII